MPSSPGIRAGSAELGPRLEAASALPRADERPGRARRPARRGDRSRLGARRGGDVRLRDERGRGRGRDARRRARSSSTSPAVTYVCGSRAAVPGSPGRPSRSRNRRPPATKSARTRSGFPDIVAGEGGGRATPPLGGGVAHRPARHPRPPQLPSSNSRSTSFRLTSGRATRPASRRSAASAARTSPRGTPAPGLRGRRPRAAGHTPRCSTGSGPVTSMIGTDAVITRRSAPRTAPRRRCSPR